jgi:hypothetical protein
MRRFFKRQPGDVEPCTRLVQAAEQEAVARGCAQLTVNTFSYQAPTFYARLGFEQYAVLEDVPVGHSKHYFRKRLDPPTG